MQASTGAQAGICIQSIPYIESWHNMHCTIPRDGASLLGTGSRHRTHFTYNSPKISATIDVKRNCMCKRAHSSRQHHVRTGTYFIPGLPNITSADNCNTDTLGIANCATYCDQTSVHNMQLLATTQPGTQELQCTMHCFLARAP
jgi:hypothetical protein